MFQGRNIIGDYTVELRPMEAGGQFFSVPDLKFLAGEAYTAFAVPGQDAGSLQMILTADSIEGGDQRVVEAPGNDLADTAGIPLWTLLFGVELLVIGVMMALMRSPEDTSDRV